MDTHNYLNGLSLANLVEYMSNNGSQHLAALTQDEVVAQHVNIIDNEIPGDLYRFVAEALWARLDPHIEGLSSADLKRKEALIDDIINVKVRIDELKFADPERQELLKVLAGLRYEATIEGDLAIVFWCRIKDLKKRRKIVKRNVLSIPYGATPYGLGQQHIDDAGKIGIQELLAMEHAWCAFLGREVYETCVEKIPRLMRLLRLFESAGAKAEFETRFLTWIVPVTKFPVVQNYTQGTIKKVKIPYNTKIYQCNVSCPECPIPLKGKQSRGASPNITHALDAAHLMLVVNSCDFPVITVHDSYGSLAPDLGTLYQKVREQFYRLHSKKPLEQIAMHIGMDIGDVDFGNYNIEEVLNSSYSFI